jgi:hypothetical protein
VANSVPLNFGDIVLNIANHCRGANSTMIGPYRNISFDGFSNNNCIIAGLNDIITNTSTVLGSVEWAGEVAGSKVS